ncbi:MAG: chemotaxis response regulator protein-glutamate methylesterase [Gammaproteobacteria bacterium]|nr:chemotaxis response regulator protein-glutamate methylesterase [Gammaproteobacteria bacterium]
MPVRVLVVDDSGFFRRRVTEILSSDSEIEVVGEAPNGAVGVEMALKLRPDVVTMDIEMPVLDGISAVRKLMLTRPTPVLMFSSLTTEGAKATLDALEAGALDFLPKRFEDIAADRNEAKKLLCSRVLALGKNGLRMASSASAATVSPVTSKLPAVNAATQQRMGIAGIKSGCKLVAIGTSTGGPIALQQVLTKLPRNFPLPLLLVQHMPESFTPAFAQRLDQLCSISVKQAVDGDMLVPGTALLAPGGHQMVLEQSSGGVTRVRIQDNEDQIYKPCVDITFSSIAKIMPGQTLALILTGMGADGREGARLLKRGGATVWAQDEQSCVVYGMPLAIVEAGLADHVLPLSEMGACLTRQV